MFRRPVFFLLCVARDTGYGVLVHTVPQTVRSLGEGGVATHEAPVMVAVDIVAPEFLVMLALTLRGERRQHVVDTLGLHHVFQDAFGLASLVREGTRPK